MFYDSPCNIPPAPALIYPGAPASPSRESLGLGSGSEQTCRQRRSLSGTQPSATMAAWYPSPEFIPTLPPYFQIRENETLQLLRQMFRWSTADTSRRNRPANVFVRDPQNPPQGARRCLQRTCLHTAFCCLFPFLFENVWKMSAVAMATGTGSGHLMPGGPR